MLSKGCRGFSGRNLAAEYSPSPCAHVFYSLTLPLVLSMSFVLSLLLLSPSRSAVSAWLSWNYCQHWCQQIKERLNRDSSVPRGFFFSRIMQKQRSNKWRNRSCNPPASLLQLYPLFTAPTFFFSKYKRTYTYFSPPSAWNIDEFCSPKWRFVGGEACSSSSEQEECKCVEILKGMGQQNARAAAAAARSCLILRTATDSSRAGKLP